MKTTKLLVLASALLLLTACVDDKDKSVDGGTTSNDPVISESSIDLTSQEQEKDFELGEVTINVDTFEGTYHEYVTVGKTYLVVLTFKDTEGNDVTASNKIEYQLKIKDGTTNMTGDWADITAGTNPGEFNLTPKSRGLDQHANLGVD